MKFLIVLALAVTVSSAAFTGSLVQQTQPLVNLIKSDLSQGLKARSSAEVGLQNAFIEGIQEYINGILGQIQGHLDQLEGGAGQLVNQIIAAVGQLQGLIANLGDHSGGGIIGGIIETIQGVISNLIGNLIGGSSRANFEISEEMSEMIQALLDQNSEVIQSSVLYNCINDNLGGGFNFEFIQNLNENNLLTPEYLLASPAVAPCLEAQGGIANIILNSNIIKRLQALVAQLGLQDVVNGFILDTLGPYYGQALLDLLAQNNRGFWDIFTGLGDLAAGAWEQLSQGASNLLTLLGNVADQAWASAAEKIAAIKAIAQAYISNGIAHAQNLGLEAAQQLVNTIVPVYEQLGQVGHDALAQLHSIYADIQIPQWILDSFNTNPNTL